MSSKLNSAFGAAIALAAVIGGQALAQSSPSAGQGMMGYGAGGPMMGGYGMMMGPMGPMMMSPMMGGYGMMGPMMIGPGYGGMMMGRQRGAGAVDLNLTVKDVTQRMERWLAIMGNSHVKLGPVAQKDGDTITADVITTDKGGLVQRFEVNRHNGLTRPAES